MRLAPLHVRSERSPLHDVRQHAHEKRGENATHCMRELAFTDEQLEKSAITAGGARRNRTDDLLLAKQALSQLSYGPALRHSEAGMVGLGRFELPTSRLSSARSNQLSYRPKSYKRQSPGTPVTRASRRPQAKACSIDLGNSVGSSEKKEKRRRRNPA